MAGTDLKSDVFDREAVFIERRLVPMTRISGPFHRGGARPLRGGVDFVRAHAPQSRLHHALSSDADAHRLARYGNGLYVLHAGDQAREDRDALRKAATSVSPFLCGTIPRPIR